MVKLVNVLRSRFSGARADRPELLRLTADRQLSEVAVAENIILQAMQDLLLKMLLQHARDNYETMRRRQREGIKLAKAQGKYKGPQEGYAA